MADDVLGVSLQLQRAFLSPQQIFDKALTGVRAQGGPSVPIGCLGCRYRTQRGDQVRACGVGHLIPDNLYEESFDASGNTSVLRLLRLVPSFKNALFEGGVDVDDEISLDLLGVIQQAHDNAVAKHVNDSDEEFLDAFERRMRETANDFELTYVPPAA
jgi:hypothetical protein